MASFNFVWPQLGQFAPDVRCMNPARTCQCVTTGQAVALLLIALATPLPIFSQLCPPNIQSQRATPANDSVSWNTYKRTSDNGYLIAGYSYFPSYGSGDFYALRLDANLEKVWESAYGGDYSDEVRVAQQTTDGGFILAGQSYSPASGNKSSTNYGGTDIWVVRTDSLGNKLWDNSYGGTNYEGVWDLKPTADGGFILGGFSYSDASGNKSDSNYGDADYWVVRIDANGNKIWDRSFGGTGQDFMFSVRETVDGGFIVGGSSDSPPDGTKTTLNFGGLDYWIIRLDASGNELWQRSYGGSGTDQLTQVEETTDGGFILLGSSDSPQSGNKTTPNFGFLDLWIVRTDSNGDVVWQQSFGTGNSAIPQRLLVVPTGGWLVGATAYPGVSGGNKTSRNFGDSDYWLLRLDSYGNLAWDQSYGGRQSDVLFDMERTADGGVALIGSSSSPVGGNKTIPLLSWRDLWVLKLASETPQDCDGDGIPDAQDLCPGTPAGAIVNTNGCSVSQFCPCDGGWTNHDEYVGCVSRVSADFVRDGLMTEEQRTNMIAQAGEANCPYIPVPIIAFGLTNFALHDAAVTASEEGPLVVSNLGPEGEQGVSVQLGEADSGVFIYPDAPVQDNYSEAWFLLGKAYGKVNGVTNGLICTMRATKPYYETYPVSVDFSSLGATGLTYQVYRHNVLIAETSTPGPTGSITINSASHLNPRGNPCWREVDGSLGASIDLNVTEEVYRFSITGPFLGDDLQGDHIFIRPDPATNVVDFVSRMDIFGAAVDSFSIVNAKLGMFKRPHQALGSAVFTAAAGKLTVSKRTDGGEVNEFAGTMVEMRDSFDLDIDLQPLLLDTNGASFQLFASGIIDGGVQMLGFFGITNQNQGLELSADFSQLYYSLDPTNLQPHVLLITVYTNGTMAGTITNSPAERVLTIRRVAAGEPSIPAIIACGSGIDSNSIPSFLCTLDQESTFTDGAGPILRGNQFRIAPISPERESGLISTFSLGVLNVPSFTIVGETSESQPLLSIARSADTVVLSWPIQKQPFILESTASFGTTFSIVTNDVAFSEGRNVVTIPLDTTGSRFFRLRFTE